MANKVLIADPDVEWTSQMGSFFETSFPDVELSNNGKDVQKKLYSGGISTLVLSYELEDFSANKVIKYIQSNHKDLILIVLLEREHLAGNEDILNDLKRMGVNEILVKPFTKEKLKSCTESYFNVRQLYKALPKRETQSEEVEVKNEQGDFCQIPVDDFYSLESVFFDVYIKIGKDHFIKIFHSGDKFSKERIEKYQKEKGVEFLYFHKNDREKFVKLNDFVARKTIKSHKLHTRSKARLIKNVAEKFMEESFEEGIKTSTLNQGRQICENVYYFVTESKDLYKLFRELNEFDPNQFTHSYLVTLFSSSIIKQFEWQSKTVVENTALACMFHDIGKTKLPKSLLNKSSNQMNSEELKLYREHPVLSVKALEDVREINHSIKQIILQHHEAYDGTGYPYNVSGNKVLLLSNIISCADTLVGIMCEKKINPLAALKLLLVQPDQLEKFHPTVIEKLIHIFAEPKKLKSLAESKDKKIV